ncbi:MAG: class I SAM-dependent methyltransferase, partial [Nannocystaceae bacterium]
MAVDETRAHWEAVYRDKAAHELSWYQEEPQISCALIGADPDTPLDVLDVGGGQSALAARLATDGHRVTVLDLASEALARGRRRAGALASRIRWVQGDVTEDPIDGTFDVWHDRAVFHFLTTPQARENYADALHRRLRPNGRAVIGTFGIDGPERCSNLPVCRYEPSGLVDALGGNLELESSQNLVHATPWGSQQSFLFVVVRRSR